jgi:metallophosphoesterase (TIGR00282 family)
MPDLVDCPFQVMQQHLERWQGDRALLFCDFHAEATSEKVAFGYFVDGKAIAVVGTHTHVQTADERVLAGGTAYISDAGMCGPEDGVLGCEREPIIEKFLTGRPQRFDVAAGPAIVNGVVVDVDPEARRATRIERIFIRAA